MIVSKDSPLRKIPSALDRKQAFFIEGIRVSLEVIDFAHQRMQGVLLGITEGTLSKQPLNQQMLTSVVLDAWSIVDSVHRLCELIDHFPRIKHRNRIPALRELAEANKLVETLRNTVQHLPGHIDEMTDIPCWSVWGALAWCMPTMDGDKVHCGIYFCGRAEPGTKPPFVNPIGKKILMPIGQITLHQGAIRLCLSDLNETVAKFAATFEKMLADSFAGKPELQSSLAADVLLVVSMALGPEEPMQEASAGE